MASTLEWLFLDDLKWNFREKSETTQQPKDSKTPVMTTIRLKILCWDIPWIIFNVEFGDAAFISPTLRPHIGSFGLCTHAASQNCGDCAFVLQILVESVSAANPNETKCCCSASVKLSSCCCQLTSCRCIRTRNSTMI